MSTATWHILCLHEAFVDHFKNGRAADAEQCSSIVWAKPLGLCIVDESTRHFDLTHRPLVLSPPDQWFSHCKRSNRSHLSRYGELVCRGSEIFAGLSAVLLLQRLTC